MGYGTCVKCYKIWLDGKIILSRSVVFDESSKSNTVEIEVGAEKKKAKEVEDEPSTYWAPITSFESAQWIAAMEEEMESLSKNSTWELQPTCKVLLAMVAHQKLELEQLDVKTTFLHGEMEEEIYMNEPEGFQVPGKEDYVCKLKRSLYGLKQSPRQWYKREHWQAVKLIFRYLRDTSDIDLCYGANEDILVAGFSYSYYAVDIDSRRSMTGYVFTLGGSVVNWKSTLQPTVNLSISEAEYMALTKAAKEGIWLKHIVNDLGLHQDQAIVHCDSLSAICLTKDQVHHERTKHIDIRYHFLRNESRMRVKKVGTDENSTDMFTKPVPKNKPEITQHYESVRSFAAMTIPVESNESL
ncbi:hypothetical protein AXG93_1952s1130 [Marchantia polymorpha subsp. ruderalis]|uniref:Reverse transcriptase Ty1/copia-type domain-containing protein n=1 Tax=Marchantia polymorpha subsp. ruderalis TaxID=1480154 RepID=A0A176WL96_MARPO|nr:hypothetical protein AXG93_1952s1130 [Marchantia polymorpha subsp. ruderalis]